MPETKVFSFGNDGNSRNGFDASLLWPMMLMGGGGGFGGWGGNWLIPFLLFGLFGENGFGGFGGFGNRFGGGGGIGYLANQLNNDTGREIIMQAIQGNTNAISQLSSTLNCSVGDLRNALSAINTQLCNVGNSVNMTSMQVINAIQAGNCQLGAQLAQCCCDLKTAIGQTNVALERGFSSVAYETQRQTCDIQKSIENSTSRILEGQRAAEMRELQRDIAERDRELAKKDVIINNAQQTNAFSQMLNQATAPLYQAVTGVKSDIDELKCRMPKTVTLPYAEAQAIPNCVAYGLGLNGPGVFGGNPNSSFF